MNMESEVENHDNIQLHRVQSNIERMSSLLSERRVKYGEEAREYKE